jgi:hypothetical protein
MKRVREFRRNSEVVPAGLFPKFITGKQKNKRTQEDDLSYLVTLEGGREFGIFRKISQGIGIGPRRSEWLYLRETLKA